MSNAAGIPNNSRHDVVTFDILTGHATLQPVDESIEIMSISIIREVNRIPTARLVVRDGDAASGKFETSEKDMFNPGKKIQIKIGLDRSNKTLFKGIITRFSIKVKEQGISDLVIECKDETVKLSVGRHSKYFDDKKDSEVIEEIISGYKGLTADVEPTSLKHKELVQHHCSDWDFILARAEMNGRLVTVEDGRLSVKKPDTRQDAGLKLAFGSSMLEFEAEMDARWQWGSVEAKSWDYAGQQLFNQSSDSADVQEPGNLSGNSLSETLSLAKFEIHHSGHVIEEELKAWADACMLKSRLAKVRGRAKFTGFPDIKPGQVVNLSGVGPRFTGNAFVSAVRHEIAGGAWDTQVQFGMSPDWFASQAQIADFEAAGLLPGIRGLQIGKVVQLQDDPDGQDRILVRLPIIDPAAQGIWSRVASLDAGANRGAFFRPEIDDEVIVGFVNDDPRDAIILGMLHSSAKPAPINAQDVNHEKGFVTRSDMRIHFHDETKTITISTPGGNTVKIDESSMSILIQDQNKNKINLGPTGIDIESPKNVNIKAGINLSLSAAASLSIGGASIGVSASGNVELKGAVAKLSGQGIAEISGGLVKIN